jgi:maleylpyruvate isomerase
MVPLEEIQDATHRLIRTVDDMADEEYAAPSLLPDWSRGHVVAHLTLNAEGLAAALRGVARERPTPMYPSPERRDSDIADLAPADPATQRTRLLGATTEFAEAVAAVPEDGWGTEIERTPGGPTFKAGAVPGMRDREVEIHHADLGLAYTRADWPTSFSARLLEAMAKRERARPFVVRATDLDRQWRCGPDGTENGTVDGPTVSGAAADLGWWLAGRGDGDGLTRDDGALPGIEAW